MSSVPSRPTAFIRPRSSTISRRPAGNGDYDWLVVKYNTSGQVVWAKNYGSTLGDFADGVALDASGNVYVTGFFNSTMTVQGITVTSRGIFGRFLAKFDPNGILLWLKTAGGTGLGPGSRSGGGRAGQRWDRRANFRTRRISIHVRIKAAGLGDAFIAKYDAAGNNLWVHGGGSTTSFAGDAAKAIAVDAANNFFITGDYTGTATFDGLSVPNTGTNGSDIFLAKYDSVGAIQWLHHAGGPDADKGYSIGVDLAGNSWVTGFADSGLGVVFDTIELPPLGNEYIFLAKYDPAGSVQYVKQYAAGTGQDIHVLNNGVLYLNGGASKANGNEFDDISLVYNDRGGFICQFAETVDPGCEPPAGVTASNITSNSATISWSAVPGAEGYLVQFRKLGTTRWRTKQALRTSVRLKNLFPSTSYEYQVATLCPGETSPYSAVQVFTTNP